MNGETRLAAFAQSLLGTETSVLAPQGNQFTLEAKINGQPADVVYRLLSRADRRAHGVFFSGHIWARKLTEGLDVARWGRFLDPSAGIGDLLLEVCRHLPLERTPSETLEAWCKRLYAMDLRESFLRIAWARIQALVMVRHNISGLDGASLPSLPSSFRAGDMLATEFKLRTDDCVIMNPPYQLMAAGRDSFVGSGLRSAAALHVERILQEAPSGVGVVALVPDVLRSGSSYRRFRREIDGRMEITSFEGIGKFGGSADVDVAVLFGVTRQRDAIKPVISSGKDSPRRQLIGDFCEVRVGSVVPHRTAETGKRLGYLTAKNAPVWGAILAPTAWARFEARTETAPFVVVRRTSSPRDKQRARATIVRGTDNWLIENHLLVIRPVSGTLKDCKVLLQILQDSRTNEWLNERIRCRHLTVEAISSLPWWKK